MRPVPQSAVRFVKAHEGCKLTSYRDTGGVLTVGYGHTSNSVIAGQTISQAQADDFLRDDLSRAAQRLAGVVNEPTLLKLTDNQYAALLSFVFNLGCQSSWTIWKRLNAGKFDQVPAEMGRFVNAGGKKVQGLVNRRAAEVVLWSTSEPGSVPDTLSSATTRAEPTPPTPAPANTSHLVTAAVGAVSTVTVAAKTVSDTLQPFADHSPIVGQVVVGLATLGAAATVIGLGLAWLHSRHAKQ